MVKPSLSLVVVLLLCSGPAAAEKPECKKLPDGTGPALGIDSSLAGDLDALLHDAVATGQTESAAALVARRGQVFYRGVAGSARVDTVWDLASVTKVVATTTAVMQLLSDGKLTLQTPVARHLPLVDVPDKRAITVKQLLLHISGLHSVVPRGALTDGRAVILGRIQRSRLRSAPGTRFRYSDIGFILLGELVAAVARQPLDRYTALQVLEPLGMCDTRFNPARDALLRPRLVSHWPEGGKPGQVYDPLAARMGGVAGHAGLYSTVDDLARLGQMLLNGGELDGVRVLGRAAVTRMLSPHELPGGKRGLGWLLNLHPGGSTRHLSRRAFGHGGYTGSSLWVDPERQLVLVLLTNRTRITPLPSSRPLLARFHDLVIGACSVRSHGRGTSPLRTGLDRLVQQRFAPLSGRRVGLITNRTAVDRRGRWIVDLMADAGVRLTALFVPEHGLDARVDRRVSDTTLRYRGHRIPVHSLFGRRRRPDDATLRGVDTLVFDMAAVGVRYYTYLSTMGWAMEEAARRKLDFFVLDRPDPLGGVAVQGPLSTDRTPSSTNYHPLPVRYGMTLGELARMFNRERHIDAHLTVVPIQGWRRWQRFDDQDRPWIDPSPNIRSWRQALLYAGVGLLEGTNLSVGRGTDAPFMVLGAPWIDGAALARAVNRANLPGAHAVAVNFTPRAAPYRQQVCHGVRLLLTDPERLDAPALGMVLAGALLRLHPDRWKRRHLQRLVRHAPTIQVLEQGQSWQQIRALWQVDLARFRRQRRQFLLY